MARAVVDKSLRNGHEILTHDKYTEPVNALQFGIPGGDELYAIMGVTLMVGIVFAALVWVLAGRRDSNHRLAWTSATLFVALGSAGSTFGLTAVVVLPLLLVVTSPDRPQP